MHTTNSTRKHDWRHHRLSIFFSYSIAESTLSQSKEKKKRHSFGDRFIYIYFDSTADVFQFVFCLICGVVCKLIHKLSKRMYSVAARQGIVATHAYENTSEREKEILLLILLETYNEIDVDINLN